MKKIAKILLYTLISFLLFNVSYSETLQEEAARRIPPVLYSLEIPESFVVGQSYTIRWSILGYDDSYKSQLAFFECDENNHNCGGQFNSNSHSSNMLSPVSQEQGSWTYHGIRSTIFNYEYNFTIPFVLSPRDVVARFYQINDIDEAAGKSGLSLLIPGNLANRYYDRSGRRIMASWLPTYPAAGTDYIHNVSVHSKHGMTVSLRVADFSYIMEGIEYPIVYELLLETTTDFPKFSALDGLILFAYKHGLYAHIISVEGQYKNMGWRQMDEWYGHHLPELTASECAVAIGSKLFSTLISYVGADIILDGAKIIHSCAKDLQSEQPKPNDNFTNTYEYNTVSIPFTFPFANQVKIHFVLERQYSQIFSENSAGLDIFIEYKSDLGSDQEHGTIDRKVNLPLY